MSFEQYWVKLVEQTPALKSEVIMKLGVKEFKRHIEKAYRAGFTFYRQEDKSKSVDLPEGFESLFRNFYK